MIPRMFPKSYLQYFFGSQDPNFRIISTLTIELRATFFLYLDEEFFLELKAMPFEVFQTYQTQFAIKPWVTWSICLHDVTQLQFDNALTNFCALQKTPSLGSPNSLWAIKRIFPEKLSTTTSELNPYFIFTVSPKLLIYLFNFIFWNWKCSACFTLSMLFRPGFWKYSQNFWCRFCYLCYLFVVASRNNSRIFLCPFGCSNCC